MLKALVVDDSRVMRVATRVVMERLGMEVIEAEDGVRGIERFREDRPDMVLIDVRMPGMDGYDVVRELRKLSDDWVPIIFVSAIEQEHGVEKANRKGVEFHLHVRLDYAPGIVCEVIAFFADSKGKVDELFEPLAV